ncbi:hypothetical protein HK101_000895 [Irineochytrium annulatum]|nr:hypothetical protein HK101_000895 [Irineochytrium annulatum]
MTGCHSSASGQTVGIAWVNTACQSKATADNGVWISGTGVSSIVPVEGMVMAHEMGHNLGAMHDCDATACAASTLACRPCGNSCDCKGQYIMNPTDRSSSNQFSRAAVRDVKSCDGLSKFCPLDLFKPNKLSCGNGLQCASGICTSRKTQCQAAIVLPNQTGGQVNTTDVCQSSLSKDYNADCQRNCLSSTGECLQMADFFIEGTPCGRNGLCYQNPDLSSYCHEDLPSTRLSQRRTSGIDCLRQRGGIAPLAREAESGARTGTRDRAFHSIPLQTIVPPPSQGDAFASGGGLATPPRRVYELDRETLASGTSGVDRGGEWDGGSAMPWFESTSGSNPVTNELNHEETQPPWVATIWATMLTSVVLVLFVGAALASPHLPDVRVGPVAVDVAPMAVEVGPPDVGLISVLAVIAPIPSPPPLDAAVLPIPTPFTDTPILSQQPFPVTSKVAPAETLTTTLDATGRLPRSEVHASRSSWRASLRRPAMVTDVAVFNQNPMGGEQAAQLPEPVAVGADPSNDATPAIPAFGVPANAPPVWAGAMPGSGSGNPPSAVDASTRTGPASGLIMAVASVLAIAAAAVAAVAVVVVRRRRHERLELREARMRAAEALRRRKTLMAEAAGYEGGVGEEDDDDEDATGESLKAPTSSWRRTLMGGKKMGNVYRPANLSIKVERGEDPFMSDRERRRLGL